MAEPKNPYNNIEKELTLVGNPILDPDPIDVQVDDEVQIDDDYVTGRCSKCKDGTGFHDERDNEYY